MITSCTTWIFLCILTCYEILQFLSKLVAAIKGDGYSKLHEYYSQQNICEIIMLGLCQSFFIIRSMAPELKNEESELLMHLLGWSLFMAWLDLTIFLARFNIFGKHIYRHGFWNLEQNLFDKLQVMKLKIFIISTILKDTQLFKDSVRNTILDLWSLNHWVSIYIMGEKRISNLFY